MKLAGGFHKGQKVLTRRQRRGTVVGETPDGRLQVKFPSGVYAMRPGQLVDARYYRTASDRGRF